ncbi:hypothetical protein niasHT_016254 [Heterodera trifolii]|uniref:Uncharacterized protein n=1 Tax=Heterodera trifolii TaxID=157864 RepID=A0ABD2LIV3_9BILA
MQFQALPLHPTFKFQAICSSRHSIPGHSLASNIQIPAHICISNIQIPGHSLASNIQIPGPMSTANIPNSTAILRIQHSNSRPFPCIQHLNSRPFPCIPKFKFQAICASNIQFQAIPLQQHSKSSAICSSNISIPGPSLASTIQISGQFAQSTFKFQASSLASNIQKPRPFAHQIHSNLQASLRIQPFQICQAISSSYNIQIPGQLAYPNIQFQANVPCIQNSNSRPFAHSNIQFYRDHFPCIQHANFPGPFAHPTFNSRAIPVHPNIQILQDHLRIKTFKFQASFACIQHSNFQAISSLQHTKSRPHFVPLHSTFKFRQLAHPTFRIPGHLLIQTFNSRPFPCIQHSNSRPSVAHIKHSNFRPFWRISRLCIQHSNLQAYSLTVSIQIFMACPFDIQHSNFRPCCASNIQISGQCASNIQIPGHSLESNIQIPGQLTHQTCKFRGHLLIHTVNCQAIPSASNIQIPGQLHIQHSNSRPHSLASLNIQIPGQLHIQHFIKHSICAICAHPTFKFQAIPGIHNSNCQAIPLHSRDIQSSRAICASNIQFQRPFLCCIQHGNSRPCCSTNIQIPGHSLASNIQRFQAIPLCIQHSNFQAKLSHPTLCKISGHLLMQPFKCHLRIQHSNFQAIPLRIQPSISKAICARSNIKFQASLHIQHSNFQAIVCTLSHSCIQKCSAPFPADIDNIQITGTVAHTNIQISGTFESHPTFNSRPFPCHPTFIIAICASNIQFQAIPLHPTFKFQAHLLIQHSNSRPFPCIQHSNSRPFALSNIQFQAIPLHPTFKFQAICASNIQIFRPLRIQHSNFRPFLSYNIPNVQAIPIASNIQIPGHSLASNIQMPGQFAHIQHSIPGHSLASPNIQNSKAICTSNIQISGHFLAYNIQNSRPFAHSKTFNSRPCPLAIPNIQIPGHLLIQHSIPGHSLASNIQITQANLHIPTFKFQDHSLPSNIQIPGNCTSNIQIPGHLLIQHSIPRPFAHQTFKFQALGASNIQNSRAIHLASNIHKFPGHLRTHNIQISQAIPLHPTFHNSRPFAHPTFNPVPGHSLASNIQIPGHLRIQHSNHQAPFPCIQYIQIPGHCASKHSPNHRPFAASNMQIFRPFPLMTTYKLPGHLISNIQCPGHSLASNIQIPGHLAHPNIQFQAIPLHPTIQIPGHAISLCIQHTNSSACLFPCIQHSNSGHLRIQHSNFQAINLLIQTIQFQAIPLQPTFKFQARLAHSNIQISGHWQTFQTFNSRPVCVYVQTFKFAICAYNIQIPGHLRIQHSNSKAIFAHQTFNSQAPIPLDIQHFTNPGQFAHIQTLSIPGHSLAAQHS